MSLLAALVLFACTRARLSQYEPVTAPTKTFAKVTKLVECRPKLVVIPVLLPDVTPLPDPDVTLHPIEPGVHALLVDCAIVQPPPLRL